MEIRLITGNKGKLREISGWMERSGAILVAEEETFVEVQADTLEEVVRHGMDDLTRKRGEDLWLMKDDSGLFIDALDGFPGVYSSYVQRTVGNSGILRLMDGEENRSATFVTVIGLFIPGKGLSLFRGECRGSIIREERGKQGFGFDPIFVPEGRDETFAEMGVEEKNSMSHRIRAVRKMIEHISVPSE